MKYIVTIYLFIVFIFANGRVIAKSDLEIQQRGIKRVKSTISYSLSQIALVIGNNQYEYSPLLNPVNDAKDMAQVLSNIGFEVILKTNLNQRGMEDAVYKFSQRLSKNQAVGLFYFAGHGAQIDGQNYLLPIDNKRLRDETDLKYHAIDADKVLEKMENAKTRLTIIILDACRDNPYQGGTRSLRRGLAHMQPSLGSIIAFATDKGETAADSSSGGHNGLFTKHLLEILQTAQQIHLRIDDMFMQVRNRVLKESEGAQEPWYLASLKEPFCFGGCQTITTMTAPAASKISAKTPFLSDEIPPSKQPLQEIAMPPFLQEETTPSIDESLTPETSIPSFLQEPTSSLIEEKGKQESSLQIAMPSFLQKPTPLKEDRTEPEQSMQIATPSFLQEPNPFKDERIDPEPSLQIAIPTFLQKPTFLTDSITTNDRQEVSRQIVPTSPFLQEPSFLSKKGKKHIQISSPLIFRDHLREGGKGPEMIWIRAGHFQMGDIQGGGWENEKPIHSVSIKRFAMGRYEVTFAEYDRFVKASDRKQPYDSNWKRGHQPVINISWQDAIAYTQWLTQQTNRQYRLPTEAEWEYAARGGTNTKYWWGNELKFDKINCNWPMTSKTQPVGSFEPNPFGLYDILGNVWEWCADSWHKNYKGAPEEGHAWEKEGHLDYRLLRGGSWFNNLDTCRSAQRLSNLSTTRNDVIGFRVVAEP